MGAHYGHLSYWERLAIFDGRYRGLGVVEIARQLGRSPSTVSRELRRGSCSGMGYDPAGSQFGTLRRRTAKRPERHKLRPSSSLFGTVAAQLREGWSPLLIAGRLRLMEADDPRGRVSHETIYLALYALPRGEIGA